MVDEIGAAGYDGPDPMSRGTKPHTPGAPGSANVAKGQEAPDEVVLGDLQDVIERVSRTETYRTERVQDVALKLENGTLTAPEASPGGCPKNSEPRAMKASRRPFLGIIFKCCHAYGRIYRNAGHTAYEGKCPGCMREVSARIAPSGGTPKRFFGAQPRQGVYR